MITSTTNPAIKRIVKLRSRRERERSGHFIIEGTREVQRAVVAGVDLLEVYSCPELHRPATSDLIDDLSQRNARIIETSVAAFEKASGRQGPDGILAVAVKSDTNLDDLVLSAAPLIVVTDGIEKPGNLGAIVRTAAAAGADAVAVTGTGTDPFNPSVIRASQGSLFSIPVLPADAPQLADWLDKRGIIVRPADPEAQESCWETDLTGPLAIVIGSEATGLSTVWSARSQAVSIPMAGSGDSLNASAAAAVLLFEAARQRSSGFAQHPEAIIAEDSVKQT